MLLTVAISVSSLTGIIGLPALRFLWSDRPIGIRFRKTRKTVQSASVYNPPAESLSAMWGRWNRVDARGQEIGIACPDTLGNTAYAAIVHGRLETLNACIRERADAIGLSEPDYRKPKKAKPNGASRKTRKSHGRR